MSGKAMGMVWELEIPHSQQFVLLAMADHADQDGGKIFPSVSELAWKTGYSDRQVRRIVKQLRDTEVLELIKSNYGKYGTNCYKIRWDKAPKKPARPDGDDILSGGADKKTTPPDILTPPPDIQMSPDPSSDPSVKPSIDSFFATFDKSQLYLVNSLDKQICSIPYATLLEVPTNHRGWTTIIGIQLDKKRFSDYAIVDTLPFKEESEDPPKVPQKGSQSNEPHSDDKQLPEPTIPDGYQWWFAGDKANVRHLLWLGKDRPKCKPKHWQHPNKWNPQLQGYAPCAECVRIANEPKVPRKQVTLSSFEKMIAVIVLGFRTDQTMQANIPMIRKFQRLALNNEGYTPDQMPTPEQAQALGDDLRDKWQHWYRAKCKDCDMPSGKDGSSFSKWYGQWVDAGKPSQDTPPTRVSVPSVYEQDDYFRRRSGGG